VAKEKGELFLIMHLAQGTGHSDRLLYPRARSVKPRSVRRHRRRESPNDPNAPRVCTHVPRVCMYSSFFVMEKKGYSPLLKKLYIM
jgi:hypothetical protein